MFVVFEGIDGSGKTTVSNRVAERLRAAGLTVEHLREGGKFTSRVTQALREFGRDARNLELTPEAEFFLYVTRDVQLLEEMTRPALGRADIVIADRFLFSAEVLARFGRGLPEAYVRPVLQTAARGLEPDLVVLVDIDPHIARARRKIAKLVTVDRRPPSRKGLGGVGMQHRFREGYRELAARDPARWVTVDNDRDLEVTVDLVTQILRTAHQGGVPAGLALARTEAPTSGPTPTPPRSIEEGLMRFLDRVDRRMDREPQTAAYLLAGLHGRLVDERRQRLLPLAPETLLGGMNGLVDDLSWQLREALMPEHPARVARTLRGPARLHPRAAALRAALVDSVPLEVVAALETADDPEAWQLRERVFASDPDAVVASLGRLDSTAAWRLRDEWLNRRGGDAALGSYEPARVLGRSLTGLDDERAWQLRKLVREHAPIAALASLRFVLSDRAWKWRERYLGRAPKTVFETLARVDDPRAWQMRSQMAPLVKEAIDSLNELDVPQAWELRERFADTWPSTVVKSLGRLADQPRGRALVERQLRRHPDNISLLKHVAAIAIGAHLDPELTPE
jgi:dTMP kinase